LSLAYARAVWNSSTACAGAPRWRSRFPRANQRSASCCCRASKPRAMVPVITNPTISRRMRMRNTPLVGRATLCTSAPHDAHVELESGSGSPQLAQRPFAASILFKIADEEQRMPEQEVVLEVRKQELAQKFKGRGRFSSPLHFGPRT